jgi:hypothetical protein
MPLPGASKGMEHHPESPSRALFLEPQQHAQYSSKMQELASPATASASSLSPVPLFSTPRDVTARSHASLVSSVSSAISRDDSNGKMDVDSVHDRGYRSTSVLSMDDIEAAQALEGLRSGMFTGLSDLLALVPFALKGGRGTQWEKTRIMDAKKTD